MLRVGIIGYGYWGPNLARNFHRHPGCQLKLIADLDLGRLQKAAADVPGVHVTASVNDAVNARDIDAIIIATPIRTHFRIALAALKADKHVLVEKPMAASVSDCETLIAEAERRGLTLMVDHTFLFTEAVQTMKKLAVELGDLYYFDSVRANLGLFQRDVSVVWDLAPHDLAILHYLVELPVDAVTATGACHAGSRVPNIAYLSLELGGGAMAHFHVSWLSPVKSRRIVVAGSRKMMVFDDIETSEKLKVYDSGVSIKHDNEDGEYRMQVDYRTGDMVSPALANREALQSEVEHFLRCIDRQEKPLSDGQGGLAVVRVLEAAQRSLERNGERVLL
jgi:predicted dehydrogenase